MAMYPPRHVVSTSAKRQPRAPSAKARPASKGATEKSTPAQLKQGQVEELCDEIFRQIILAKPGSLAAGTVSTALRDRITRLLQVFSDRVYSSSDSGVLQAQLLESRTRNAELRAQVSKSQLVAAQAEERLQQTQAKLRKAELRAERAEERVRALSAESWVVYDQGRVVAEKTGRSVGDGIESHAGSEPYWSMELGTPRRPGWATESAVSDIQSPVLRSPPPGQAGIGAATASAAARMDPAITKERSRQIGQAQDTYREAVRKQAEGQKRLARLRAEEMEEEKAMEIEALQFENAARVEAARERLGNAMQAQREDKLKSAVLFGWVKEMLRMEMDTNTEAHQSHVAQLHGQFQDERDAKIDQVGKELEKKHKEKVKMHHLAAWVRMTVDARGKKRQDEIVQKAELERQKLREGYTAQMDTNLERLGDEFQEKWEDELKGLTFAGWLRRTDLSRHHNREQALEQQRLDELEALRDQHEEQREQSLEQLESELVEHYEEDLRARMFGEWVKHKMKEGADRRAGELEAQIDRTRQEKDEEREQMLDTTRGKHEKMAAAHYKKTLKLKAINSWLKVAKSDVYKKRMEAMDAERQKQLAAMEEKFVYQRGKNLDQMEVDVVRKYTRKLRHRSLEGWREVAIKEQTKRAIDDLAAKGKQDIADLEEEHEQEREKHLAKLEEELVEAYEDDLKELSLGAWKQFKIAEQAAKRLQAAEASKEAALQAAADEKRALADERLNRVEREVVEKYHTQIKMRCVAGWQMFALKERALDREDELKAEKQKALEQAEQERAKLAGRNLDQLEKELVEEYENYLVMKTFSAWVKYKIEGLARSEVQAEVDRSREEREALEAKAQEVADRKLQQASDQIRRKIEKMLIRETYGAWAWLANRLHERKLEEERKQQLQNELDKFAQEQGELREKNMEKVGDEIKRRYEEQLMGHHLLAWRRLVFEERARREVDAIKQHMDEEREALLAAEETQRELVAERMATGLRRRIEMRIVQVNFQHWLLWTVMAQLKKEEEEMMAQKEEELYQLRVREEARVEKKVDLAANLMLRLSQYALLSTITCEWRIEVHAGTCDRMLLDMEQAHEDGMARLCVAHEDKLVAIHRRAEHLMEHNNIEAVLLRCFDAWGCHTQVALALSRESSSQERHEDELASLVQAQAQEREVFRQRMGAQGEYMHATILLQRALIEWFVGAKLLRLGRRTELRTQELTDSFEDQVAKLEKLFIVFSERLILLFRDRYRLKLERTVLASWRVVAIGHHSMRKRQNLYTQHQEQIEATKVQTRRRVVEASALLMERYVKLFHHAWVWRCLAAWMSVLYDSGKEDEHLLMQMDLAKLRHQRELGFMEVALMRRAELWSFRQQRVTNEALLFRYMAFWYEEVWMVDRQLFEDQAEEFRRSERARRVQLVNEMMDDNQAERQSRIVQLNLLRWRFSAREERVDDAVAFVEGQLKDELQKLADRERQRRDLQAERWNDWLMVSMWQTIMMFCFRSWRVSTRGWMLQRKEAVEREQIERRAQAFVTDHLDRADHTLATYALKVVRRAAMRVCLRTWYDIALMARIDFFWKNERQKDGAKHQLELARVRSNRRRHGASVGTELMNLVDRPYDDHVMKLVFTMWMLLCQAVAGWRLQDQDRVASGLRFNELAKHLERQERKGENYKKAMENVVALLSSACSATHTISLMNKCLLKWCVFALREKLRKDSAQIAYLRERDELRKQEEAARAVVPAAPSARRKSPEALQWDRSPAPTGIEDVVGDTRETAFEAWVEGAAKSRTERIRRAQGGWTPPQAYPSRTLRRGPASAPYLQAERERIAASSAGGATAAASFLQPLPPAAEPVAMLDYPRYGLEPGLSAGASSTTSVANTLERLTEARRRLNERPPEEPVYPLPPA